MKHSVRRFLGIGFVVAAVISLGSHCYSAWKMLSGEVMTGKVIGIADVRTGPEVDAYVSTIAIETREHVLMGKKHIFACGEVVDKFGSGLRFTFLGDVYEKSPKVDFKPLNVAYNQ